MVRSITKSKSTDFNSNLDPGYLQEQILANVNITTAIASIMLENDDVYIKFVSDLSANEITELNNIVSNYVPFVPPPEKGTNVFSCPMQNNFSMRAGSWTKFMSFIYQGSKIVDSLATCKVYAWKDSSVTTYQFRLQDITNNKTLFISELCTNETPAIIDGGSVANVPIDYAVLEFQLQVIGGSGKNREGYVGCVTVTA